MVLPRSSCAGAEPPSCSAQGHPGARQSCRQRPGGEETGVTGSVFALRWALSLDVINLLIQPKSLTVLWAPPGAPVPARGAPSGSLSTAQGTSQRQREVAPVPHSMSPHMEVSAWARI